MSLDANLNHFLNADGEYDVLELLNAWPAWSQAEHIEIFKKLPRNIAEDVFLEIDPKDQVEIFNEFPDYEKRTWIRLLAPDDAVDFIQVLTEDEKAKVLGLLDGQTRIEVSALAAYAEDDAGGLMSPRFARLRPEMQVEEAIRYLRAQTRANTETIYYAYALDQKQQLLGVVSLRQLFLAPPGKLVDDIMIKGEDLVSIPDDMDQEEVGRLFAKIQMVALPVVDSSGIMKGIVTIDDVVRVVREEATEDIQKLGGMEAFDAPYFKVGLLEIIKKRGGWLTVLFLGAMLTASVMGHYQDSIERAVILALFIPLIISSGGNCGSQASTLIIRSLALKEIRLQDWVKVLWRELAAGLVLGLLLGSIGFLRIVLWEQWQPTYGEHYMLLGWTVALSLVGVVLWGTISGAMLPFLFSKLSFDPASASAPFVATMVDVTGLAIYFTLASILLRGTLL